MTKNLNGKRLKDINQLNKSLDIKTEFKKN